MGRRKNKPAEKLRLTTPKSSKAMLEVRIAYRKVKVTMGDHLRLLSAESRKYSGTLDQAIRRRDVLKAQLPKGKHHPELYQLERQIRRHQTKHTFRHQRTLLAGLSGPGRPKSFYRLALESNSSLTPKQYLNDRGRGRSLTKKQRAIVMKKLEKIRASFLRSFNATGIKPLNIRRTIPLRLNQLDDK